MQFIRSITYGDKNQKQNKEHHIRNFIDSNIQMGDINDD